MQATVKEGNLIIVIPAKVKNPPVSKSGKTRIVASTHGFTRTDVEVEGERVAISLNATIPVS